MSYIYLSKIIYQTPELPMKEVSLTESSNKAGQEEAKLWFRPRAVWIPGELLNPRPVI